MSKDSNKRQCCQKAYPYSAAINSVYCGDCMRITECLLQNELTASIGYCGRSEVVATNMRKSGAMIFQAKLKSDTSFCCKFFFYNFESVNLPHFRIMLKRKVVYKINAKNVHTIHIK